MSRDRKCAHPLRVPYWWLLPLFGCLAVFASTGAHAVCLGKAPLRGVNLAGAEFNSKDLPGVMHKDYTYPGVSELDYFADKGATAIRLPVRWERVQPELFGELDSEQLGAIKKTLVNTRERGFCLILDIHNYGKYRGETLGFSEVPADAFIDLWIRLANELDDPDYLALGLMNEPFTLTISSWSAIAQQTVTALRNADARHLILVAGGRWSGVHEWFKTYAGTSNAEAFASLKDPLQRSVLEVHQYTNEGYSGTGTDCFPPEHFEPMFNAIEKWARVNGQRLFLGEFGIAPSEPCLTTLDGLLTLVNDPLLWRGWTYWAAGSWWGDYPMSVHPVNGEDATQMSVLEPYFDSWSCEQVQAGQCPESPEDVTVNGDDN